MLFSKYDASFLLVPSQFSFLRISSFVELSFDIFTFLLVKVHESIDFVHQKSKKIIELSNFVFRFSQLSETTQLSILNPSISSRAKIFAFCDFYFCYSSVFILNVPFRMNF
jgi:hypothetical protein